MIVKVKAFASFREIIGKEVIYTFYKQYRDRPLQVEQLWKKE